VPLPLPRSRARIWTIACVDDDRASLALLRGLLEDSGYVVETFESAALAVDWLDTHDVDLVLSDVRMPEGSGFELLEWFRGRKRFDTVPFVIVTSVRGIEQRVDSLHAGADDYLNKPLVPLEVIARVESLLRMRGLALRVAEQNMELRARNIDLEAKVVERTAELDRLTRGLVAALEHANLLNDHETGNHIQRVCAYSGLLANALGMDASFVGHIERYAGLHDVGKVAIPDEILKKADRLTRAEWEVMKTHSYKGYELLRAAGIHEMACSIALRHHEWWNGSGYPDGLEGEDIPIEARIVAVADCFDALTTRRPYKEPYGLLEAEAMIERASGGHFDPAVVSCFQTCRGRIRAIARELRDPDEILVGEPLPSDVGLMAAHPDGSVGEFE
jgi:response regulator RpfG family c-di-GMP phosphodiesterase